jgi:hypothetical protein
MPLASKAFKWFLVAIGSITTLFLALFALAFWYMSSGVFGTETFDEQRWAATVSNEKDATCYRGGMGLDLRDNVLSSKMKTEDVISLLGGPSGPSVKFNNSTLGQYTVRLLIAD